MSTIRFTDYDTVIYTDNNDDEVKVSRKKYYKILYHSLMEYHYSVSIRYDERNKLVINNQEVCFDEEFKTNEVDDPNSEFNKKINELIRLYEDKCRANRKPKSIEDAKYNINYYSHIRFLANESAQNDIQKNRKYILDHIDKNSEEYKIQLKERIKDLKRESTLDLLSAFFSWISLIAFITSFMLESAVLLILSLGLLSEVMALTRFRYGIEDGHLLYNGNLLRTNRAEISAIKKKIKQLNNRKVYKPLQEKQQELEAQEKKQKEIKDALNLSDIINRVETIKKQLRSINNEYSESISIELSDAIKLYSQARDNYMINPDKVDIVQEKKNLLSEINKKEDEIKKILEQQANNISQSDFELNYLNSLVEDLSNTQSSGQLSLKQGKGFKYGS